MKFTAKYFNPEAGGTLQSDGRVAFRAGDNPEDLYLYDPKTILALNVALATRRPLLISGEPGSGKSTLARGAAAVLGWRYYKQMITSRTQAADLLWKYDTLRRLSAAHNPDETLLPKQYYVEPGSLWWAFDPRTATHRGSQMEIEIGQRVRDPDLGTNVTTPKNAVVLLDEIDKADPDVPNDLLEPLDLKEFTVRETNDRVRLTDDRDLLMILTTNGEREMPPAVLRRCVLLTLAPPTKKWFVTIADLRRGEKDHALHEAVAGAVMELREAANKASLREPSTSEYLDALAVCDKLGIDTTSSDWKKAKAWQEVRRTVLWKHSMEPKLDDSEDENE